MKNQIKLLDGSLSYPLENIGYNLNTKLWTADALVNNPSLISKIHEQYLRCGVDYISTSTYQVSIKSLRDLGYKISEIEKIFHRSVKLAKNAIKKFNTNKEIKILGSFGPFATYLADGSEYTGLYNCSDEIIKNFHNENLKIIKKLDLNVILYETIPSYKEVMILLDILKFCDKEVWISLTCNHKLELRDGSSLKEACMEISKLENVSTVGINCIEPPLVAEAIRKLKKYSTKKVLIYPNSGELYNSNTKEWTGQKKLSKTHIKEWLKLSPDIIGGCCRVGTDIIKEINNQINI